MHKQYLIAPFLSFLYVLKDRGLGHTFSEMILGRTNANLCRFLAASHSFMDWIKECSRKSLQIPAI